MSDETKDKSLLEQKKEEARKEIDTKPLKKVYGKKARAFAVQVASGLTPVEAARRAGYKDGNFIQKRADVLMVREDVALAILNLRAEFGPRLAKKGMQKIEDLIETGSTEKIQLEAAKEAMKISGAHAPQRSEKLTAKVPADVIRSKYKLPGEE